MKSMFSSLNNDCKEAIIINVALNMQSVNRAYWHAFQIFHETN
jgi:hypothetical protein